MSSSAEVAKWPPLLQTHNTFGITSIYTILIISIVFNKYFVNIFVIELARAVNSESDRSVK